ncbi:MAG: hypothetical protein RLZZ381_323 [Cyanobacteriota bacterium]|jgi:hypothetical protein
MKINISTIENETAISDVQTAAANQVVGGSTLVEVDYTGIVNGYNPWQKINLNTNSQDITIDEEGNGIGTTNVTFDWSGGTGA